MHVHLDLPAEVAALWEAQAGPILHYPDPVLYRVAEPVARPDAATREIVERMKAAMRDFRGLGLAAPQIGVSRRIIIYQLPEEGSALRVIVNPRIVSRKGEQVGPEGCLSIPMLQGEVARANEVVVKGIDILGRPFRRRGTELEARVLQHEIDHLDGILFIDRAVPDTLEWCLPTDEPSREPLPLSEVDIG
ncbi:MAG: peptide deformylase [Chthonomonadales bacterium]|nr:peptide deformylase [Chthonomonadales bacterium]